MSIARQARMLDAVAQDGVMPIARRLGDAVEAMIAIQMEAYPSHWTEEERREMAERHLFGSAT